MRHNRASKSSVFVDFKSLDEAAIQIMNNSQMNLKKLPSEEERIQIIKNQILLEKEKEMDSLRQKLTVIFLLNQCNNNHLFIGKRSRIEEY